jgi:CHAT domain-containing protein/lipopolysaccharide biosynthesis regulator YciM
MKRIIVLMLLYFKPGVPVSGQEWPKATPEGQKALDALISKCVEAGSLKWTKNGNGQAVLEVIDASKLKETVKVNQTLRMPALLDSLLILWKEGPVRGRPATVALLEALSEAGQDERARAFATCFQGYAAANAQRPREAVQRYDQAAEQFAHLKESAWQALSLNNLGMAYRELGDPGKAVTCHRQALAIRRRLHGDNHSDVAQSLNNLGGAYLDLGDPSKAIHHHQQALAVWKKLYGNNHRRVADALNDLGAAYHELGDAKKAIGYIQQSLVIWKNQSGNNDSHVAALLNNLGNAYQELGNAGKAVDYYSQALAVWKKLYRDNHPDLAVTLNNLGAAYIDLGDASRAVGYYQQGLTVLKRLYGDNHPDVAIALNGLGEAYRMLQDTGKAFSYLQQALIIRKKLYGDKHPDVAYSLNSLGAVYRQLGDAGKALSYSQQALAISRQLHGANHLDVARYLDNLGEAYLDLGNASKAVSCYQQALSISKALHGENHPTVANALCALGMAYAVLGDVDKAIRYHQQALAIRKHLYGDNHLAVADTLSNLGATYHELGDVDKALGYLQQALVIRKRLYGDDHPAVAVARMNLGGAYRDWGDASKALASMTGALQALRSHPKATEPFRPGDVLPLPVTLHLLGMRAAHLEEQLGAPAEERLRRAAADYDLALALLERMREEGVESDAGKIALAEKIAALFPLRVGLAWRLYQREHRAADLYQGFTVAEQGTARVFLKSLGKARARALGGLPTNLVNDEQVLLTQLINLDRQLDRERNQAPEQRDGVAIGRLFDQRQKAEADLQVLVRRMEQEYPAYAALKYPKPCTLEAARACLSTNEVALLYILGTKASYVLLLEAPQATGDGLTIYELPPAVQLAEQISALTDPAMLASADKTAELAAEAYAALLGPLAERLAGKDLVIVPNGALCYLPFELLIEPSGKSGAPGRFLVERHRLRYAPSLTALTIQRKWDQVRSRPDRAFFALGDPVYDGADSRKGSQGTLPLVGRDRAGEYALREGHAGFPRLPFSGTEVEQIGRLLGAARGDILTGPAATEGAVKAASASGQLARYRYLHFACHGILGLASGQQPALVLSQVGDDKEDGFLQLDEVTNLKLNADLVVLSACRSGQGRLHNGEGVKGLARAFLYAGSRGVLCSLWQVDDQETARLMLQLYTNLKQGQSSAAALRNAQLDMIHKGKAPLYWAPFVLIGE